MITVLARKIYTGTTILENQRITIENGRIVSIIGEGHEPSDVKTDHAVECLSPAFIDIQVNGGTNLNFTENPDIQTLTDIAESCALLGTGFMLPTLLSSPLENILKAIEAVKNFQAAYPEAGILGMHLEGPFINPEKRGAHAASWVRKPTDAELEQIIRNGKGVLRLMTIAPEVFTNEQINMLVSSGITISAGHSNATFEQAMNGFHHGIQLVTHLYNAMSEFQPRAPGLVGAAFDSPYVATPLILDGHHSDFLAARIAYKLKRDKFFLVSDVLFTGEKKERYEWGEFNAYLHGDQYVNSEGHFAGSAISLGDAVRNAVLHVGISLPEAISMVTERPAAAIHIDKFIGRIQVGYPAVFTTFDSKLRNFATLRL